MRHCQPAPATPSALLVPAARDRGHERAVEADVEPARVEHRVRVGIVVVGAEVPAVHVVDEPVAVVVEPVARNLAGVRPDLGREIRVPEIGAGVHDADQHRRTAGRHVPGVSELDVGVVGGVDVVLQRQVRIVRHRREQPQTIVRRHRREATRGLEFARRGDGIEVGPRALEQHHAPRAPMCRRSARRPVRVLDEAPPRERCTESRLARDESMSRVESYRRIAAREHDDLTGHDAHRAASGPRRGGRRPSPRRARRHGGREHHQGRDEHGPEGSPNHRNLRATRLRPRGRVPRGIAMACDVHGGHCANPAAHAYRRAILASSRTRARAVPRAGLIR